MATTLINLAYLLAAALFIFGLKRLQSPATARGGNQLAALGMLIAVVATLFLQRILTPVEMIAGLAVGGLIGVILAKRVQMTSMPELVAAFNGFGGLASALVASAEVARYITESTPLDFTTTLTVMLSILIGMVTFSGSFIAFGKLSGKISGNPVNFPGMRALTLLLAVGSERYVPYAQERRPQELLTNANAVLGQGQLSLAKYLIIGAYEDDPKPDVRDTAAFFRHVLERFRPERDLHFQTRTTIDTLDYSGSGLNEGSKLVLAAAGRKIRDLPTEVPSDLSLPDGFSRPEVCLPGVLAVTAPKWTAEPHGTDPVPSEFCGRFQADDPINAFPLIVLVDDSEFCARTVSNFLWVTFTRSDPAADICGIDEFTDQKHWGCRGSVVIDARLKAHMAPPLEPDPAVVQRVDRLFAPGGSLHGIG